MAEGFLGGLGGFGDFLTGGGIYSDPKAINQTYGVPEGDVRQAAINQLSQLSALALAAGQPMEGSQRAQLLAQMGQTGGQFNTNLYNSAQRRLMTSQMQEKQRDLDELNTIRDLQKNDPEGLARRFGGRITPDMVKTFSANELRDIAKQITVRDITKSPLERISEQRVAQLISGGEAPAVGGIAAPSAAPSEVAAPSGVMAPDAIRRLATDPVLAAVNPELAKKYADLAAAAEPAGTKEAQVLRARTEEAKVQALPKLEQSLASRSLTTKNVLDTIEEAKKLTGPTTAGYFANLSGIQGTDAANLAEKLKTITANIGFEQLQKMRDESPTGGALGQVAVQELEALQAVLGSVKQGQSPAQLRASLDKVATTYRNFEKVRNNAFEREYGRKPDIAGFTQGVSELASPDAVKSAVQSGRITLEQGAGILRSQFEGFQ
jgi:hypothetical protein